jgi:hypothetical protein
MKTKLLSIVFWLFITSLFFSNNINAQTVGLLSNEPGADDAGYILFAPVDACGTTYLIDNCGRQIHTWTSDYSPGLDVYLLPDGTLLRSGAYPNAVFDPSEVSAGGIIQRYNWAGDLLWQYIISSPTETQDHDICYLPNGNILAAVWEVISDSEAIANGRIPSTLGTGLWTAKIEEIEPVGTNSANIVWQWRVWDHLIQDYDSTKPNYGVVADHPELLNLNFVNADDEISDISDWLHLNAITYNPTFDQIMISFRNLDEIYILDHSTDSAAAAGHSGGTYNKGGDFLYRWGNPMVYDQGTSTDTKFWGQHDPTWVTTGKYLNQIMIFNNGYGRPGGNASSVDIIAPPVDSLGNYNLVSGTAYGPDTLSWTYESTPPSNFFSTFMGSGQALTNGNTLICEAIEGHFFEIDSSGNIVWNYINPVNYGSPVAQGTTSLPLNSVYRCTFYPYSYSGFSGDTLTPGAPIELDPLPNPCTLGTPTLTANNNTVQIYPNPANNSVNIESDNLTSVELMDITGRIVTSEVYNNANSAELNTTSLSDGIYIVCINGTQYQQVVVQH